MVCPKCRENNPEGSKICKNCGTDLIVESNATNIQQNNYNQTMNNQMMSSYPNASNIVDPQPQSYNQTMNSQMPSGYPNASNTVTSQPQGYNPAMDFNTGMPQGSDSELDMNSSNFDSKTAKKPFGIFVVIIALILVIGGGIYFVINRGKGTSSGNESNVASSFFFTNSDKKAALYSADGKKLTDFIFTYKTDFNDGYALVKTDEGYGIIKPNGKMSVDIGKYQYITESSGLYKVRDNDKNEFLINGQGKVLYELKDKKIVNYLCAHTYSILEDTKASKYIVLNKNGKSLLEIKINKDIEKGPVTSCDYEGFVFVNYDGKVNIINLETGKVMYTFDSETPYCYNAIADEGKTMTFIACTAASNVMGEPRLIKDGKLLDLSNTCKKVGYSDGQFMCETTDGQKYLLDKDMNIGILISRSYANSISYIDNNTYALTIYTSGRVKGSVEFYENGSLVKTLNDKFLYEKKVVTDGVYLLRESSSQSVKYIYKTNGEMLVDKSFKSVEGFYKTDVAIVSEDLKSYYLINKNGEKLGKEYQKITKASEVTDKYFVVTDGTYKGIIDEKGNVVFEVKYKDASLGTYLNGHVYAIFLTTDSKYIVYDIENEKEVATFDKNPTLERNYISVKKSDKKQYYTYTGKMFYEE